MKSYAYIGPKCEFQWFLMINIIGKNDERPKYFHEKLTQFYKCQNVGFSKSRIILWDSLTKYTIPTQKIYLYNL